jgi:RNA-dependent RNA polymerase
LKLCRTNRVLRATEQFGKPVEHFILVDVRDENGKPIQSYHFGHLRQQLLDYLTKGFTLMGDDRQYKYLHHSQSQLRQRQFWFYHYEENSKNLSFTDAYKWMGNFDKEKNPAKHAARIALCFSTTRASVEVRTEDDFIYISK